MSDLELRLIDPTKVNEINWRKITGITLGRERLVIFHNDNTIHGRISNALNKIFLAFRTNAKNPAFKKPSDTYLINEYEHIKFDTPSKTFVYEGRAVLLAFKVDDELHLTNMEYKRGNYNYSHHNEFISQVLRHADIKPVYMGGIIGPKWHGVKLKSLKDLKINYNGLKIAEYGDLVYGDRISGYYSPNIFSLHKDYQQEYGYEYDLNYYRYVRDLQLLFSKVFNTVDDDTKLFYSLVIENPIEYIELYNKLKETGTVSKFLNEADKITSIGFASHTCYQCNSYFREMVGLLEDPLTKIYPLRLCAGCLNYLNRFIDFGIR